MSIDSTDFTSDILDNPSRELGQVGIVDNYQDSYLPLIFEQLQLISVLLAIIAEEDINLDSEVDVENMLSINEDVLDIDKGDI